MTTIKETSLKIVELFCPVCGMVFKTSIAIEIGSPTWKRTDFHQVVNGHQPLPYLMSLCLGCGYSGLDTDFKHGADVSVYVKEMVFEKLQPVVIHANGYITGSMKYEHAAKIARWRGDDTRVVAELWLKAAWCCVEEGDIEAERYFRRHAAREFELALQEFDGINDDQKSIITYLVGELWRRVSETERARPWFNKAIELAKEEGDGLLLKVAKQQRDNPQEWM